MDKSGKNKEKESYVRVVWRVVARVGMVVGSAAYRYCLVHNDVHVFQVAKG